jgi:competence protein ComEA
VDEGGKWQLIAVVAAVGLAAFAAVRFLDGGTRTGDGGVRVSRGGGARGAGAAAGGHGDARAGGPTLFVHVAGAVRRPGLYRLAEGARVANAVSRAGGATRRANLTAVNLAAALGDGQQVVVPARVGPGMAEGADGQGPISLATATAADLEELDGIGETIAERIVEYRTEHGGLRSIDELGQVDGIGEKRLEALKDELQP